MYANPYLMRLIAEEHARDMLSTAATARLARQARRSRHARLASHAALSHGTSRGLLQTIPRQRESTETMAHKAA
jgi:hypothetical protein